MRVYRDTSNVFNPWIYEHINLRNLVVGNYVMTPGKQSWINASNYDFRTEVTIGQDTITDNATNWNNLEDYMRQHYPLNFLDLYDMVLRPVRLTSGQKPKIALAFWAYQGTESPVNYWHFVCQFMGWPTNASDMFTDGPILAQHGSWNQNTSGVIDLQQIPSTLTSQTLQEIWESFVNRMNREIRFPRFFSTNFDDHGSTAGYSKAQNWILSQNGWEEEDIPVDTSWNTPRTKLISLHAWKLTNETELNYQKSLWSMDTDDTKISKSLYANPMDCIVAENFIPFQADQSQYSAREQAILVGIQELAYDGSPVKAYFMTNEYKEFNFGSKVISRYFNDYRDFTETTIELYLPCIGWKNLDAQTYMGKELIIKYRLDFVTGDILALLITNPGNVIQDVVKGNCLSTIPVSGRDFTNVLQARIQQQNGVMTAVGGFAGGALTVGAGVLAKNPMMIAGGVAGAVGSIAGGVQNARSGAANVTKAQNQVVKDGNIGGSSGVLGYGKAYLVISRHDDAMPERYQNYEGYQANKLLTVNSLTGYIKAREVYFSSARATEQEKTMVEELLKGGVFK